MAPLDALILLAFIGYALVVGLRSRRQASEGLEEYFLAGRSLRGWQAGASMAATQFAADTPLLVTGLIATAGIFSLWRLWIYAIAFLLMGFLLAPSWRRAKVITDAELAELRYGSTAAAPLRAVKAIYFGTIFNCVVLAMVLFAAREIAEPFFRWHAWLPSSVFEPLRSLVETLGVDFVAQGPSVADVWARSTDNLLSIGLIAALTLVYSTTGGLRSVVRTDIVQFSIMMLATGAYAAFVVHEAGGLGAIHASIHERFPAEGSGITASQILAFTPVSGKDVGLAVLAVIGLQWLLQMNADGSGYLAQRSMACRSDADASAAAVWFTVAQVLLRSLLWLCIGLGLLALFPPEVIPDAASDPGSVGAYVAGREATYVRGISELLPSGLKGLMLTAMIAALASTLDTHMNWGASYWTNDLYGRFWCKAWREREPGSRELVTVARISNFLILGLAFAIMTQLSSVQGAFYLSLSLGAGMGMTLVLRWIWWRVNAWGELATIVASPILYLVLLALLPDAHEPDPETQALRFLLMALGCTVAGVATSLLTPPESEQTLARFYARARPPGFWGPVARAAGTEAGEDVRRLCRGSAATLIAALSIFCVLTGLGSWIAGSPVPVAFATRGVWIAILLVTGVALVPVWWRLAFPKPS